MYTNVIQWNLVKWDLAKWDWNCNIQLTNHLLELQAEFQLPYEGTMSGLVLLRYHTQLTHGPQSIYNTL